MPYYFEVGRLLKHTLESRTLVGWVAALKKSPNLGNSSPVSRSIDVFSLDLFQINRHRLIRSDTDKRRASQIRIEITDRTEINRLSKRDFLPNTQHCLFLRLLQC